MSALLIIGVLLLLMVFFLAGFWLDYWEGQEDQKKLRRSREVLSNNDSALVDAVNVLARARKSGL